MPRKPPVGNEKHGALRPLVSNERSQKFDLLLHLISNTRDGIVICGPGGIGKSTILDLVHVAGVENWSVCRINATSATRFEDILDALAGSISADTGSAPHKSDSDHLTDILDRFKRDDRFLVLLLDDAGQMAPGIVTAVCRFADANSALRPIFTMTADLLQLTLSSDPAVANCQVVEIPPLTENQCGEFLQNLSGKPGALISFKAINPALIQYVYRKSYGVPGNIVAILPELSRGQLDNKSLSSLPMVAMVTLFGAILVGYWLLKSSDESAVPEKTSSLSGTRSGREGTAVQLDEHPLRLRQESPTRPGIDTNRPAAAILRSGSENDPLLDSLPNSTGKTLPAAPDPESVLSSPAAELNRPEQRPAPPSPPESGDQGAAVTDVSQPGENTGALTTEADEAMNAETEDSVIAEIAKTESAVETESNQAMDAEPQDFIAGIRGHRWIREQDPRQFTLQLLAVTKIEAMKHFLDSHSQLDGLAIFKTQKSGTNWYALITGAYPSFSEAKQAAGKLPAGFKNAWPRSFKSVHQAMIDSDSE